MRKYKSKNRIKLRVIFIVIMILIISSCSGGMAQRSADGMYSNVGSYVVKYNDYLFYYKYREDSADLYRYDLTNGSDEYVDTVTSPYGGYAGVVKMFLIDSRLYYGKTTDGSDPNPVRIYSIDVNDLSPRFEGSFNEMLYDYSYELFVGMEFKLFGADNNVYALANSNIYKLNSTASEKVAENVSAVCVDGDKIYYAIRFDTQGSSGIMCYDTSNNTNTEIFSDEAVKEYNRTTIYGDTCDIQNILVDDGNLYFLSTDDVTDILKYEIGGNGKVQAVTNKARMRLFRLQDDKLYYIDSNMELCCINADGTESKKLVENERVFAFNIYDNTVYYYRMVGESGYPVGLIKLDLETGEKSLIARFQ